MHLLRPNTLRSRSPIKPNHKTTRILIAQERRQDLGPDEATNGKRRRMFDSDIKSVPHSATNTLLFRLRVEVDESL